MKFACPHCQQHIEADDGYAGSQINCPACNGQMVVPGSPAPAPVVPVPPPAPVQAAAPRSSPMHVPTQAAGGTASGRNCPSCGKAIPRGIIVCKDCGYNLATGKKIEVAGFGKRAGSGAWYASPYPYLALLFVVLGIFYYLGQSSSTFRLAFLGAVVLYMLAVWVTVRVLAFRESVGTGFMVLCVPFYELYFVFGVNENDTVKFLYAVEILLGLGLRFLPLIWGSGT